jgi:hypothetical protein
MSTNQEVPHYAVFSTLPSLPPNILLSTLFLNTLSSLNVRDQVSDPCRTTGKIIVFYILIVMFFPQQTRMD